MDEIELTQDQEKYILEIEKKERTEKKVVICLPCGSGKSLIFLSIITRFLLTATPIKSKQKTLVVAPLTVVKTIKDEIETKFDGKIRYVEVEAKYSKHVMGNNHINNASIVLIGFDMLCTIYKETILDRLKSLELEKSRLNAEFRRYVDKNIATFDIFNNLDVEIAKMKELAKKSDKITPEMFDEVCKEYKEKLDIINKLINNPPPLTEKIPAPFAHLNHYKSEEKSDKGYKSLYFRRFDRIVIDEAHEGRELDMAYCNSISAISADVRVAMTGTPINNNITDVMAILKMLQCEEYESGAPLNVDLIKTVQSRYFIMPNPAAYQSIKQKFKTKEIIMYLAFSNKEETANYQSIKDKINISSNNPKPDLTFSYINKLRHACDASLLQNAASTKLNGIIEYIRQIIIPRNERGGVFFEFISSVDELIKLCNSTFNPKSQPRSLAIFKITGEIHIDKRNTIIRTFNTWKGPAVMICTVKTLAVGINLEGANHVIIPDPWWNPQRKGQAKERVRRLTQLKSTFIVSMVMKETIEEGIFCVESKKSDLNTNFMIGNIDESMLKEITTKEAITSQFQMDRLSLEETEGSSSNINNQLSTKEVSAILDESLATPCMKRLSLKSDYVITNYSGGVINFDIIPPTESLLREELNTPSKRSRSCSFQDYTFHNSTDDPSAFSSSLSTDLSSLKKPRLLASTLNTIQVLEPKNKDLPPLPKPTKWLSSRTIQRLSLDALPVSSSLNYLPKNFDFV